MAQQVVKPRVGAPLVIVGVSQRFIDLSIQTRAGRCAAALALKTVEGQHSKITYPQVMPPAHPDQVRFTLDGHRYAYNAPIELVEFVASFDPDRNKAQPFELFLDGGWEITTKERDAEDIAREAQRKYNPDGTKKIKIKKTPPVDSPERSLRSRGVGV